MKKNILKRMADAESKSDEAGESSFVRRHSSPVITNVGRALTQLSEDSIVSLDPNRIEPSPFKDRFNSDADSQQELEVLKSSIAAEGQKIPVLVRPHPSKSGLYQLAYGYRRVAAIKSLLTETGRAESLKVKAYVRELSDRQLIEEQSLENSVRENLTWIEQAILAVQLKDAGFTQRAICPILGLTESAISHFSRVTSIIPEDVIYAIGRAKSVGRPKWTALAERLQRSDNVRRVRSILANESFRLADSRTRFAQAFAIAKDNSKLRVGVENEEQDFLLGPRLFGRLKQTASGTQISIPKHEAEFANWLACRMPDLIREYSERLKS